MQQEGVRSRRCISQDYLSHHRTNRGEFLQIALESKIPEEPGLEELKIIETG